LHALRDNDAQAGFWDKDVCAVSALYDAS